MDGPATTDGPVEIDCADENTAASMLTGAAGETLGEILRTYWGFSDLRPMQAQAIDAGLDKRDSLVVMPTGGGKSLCYQVPPLLAERLDIVVSPLISLMKDQVDGLVASGYPAAAIHSQMTESERSDVYQSLREGSLRLLFVSPERLVMSGFQGMIRDLNVGAIAVDEAHCISHWGHDFRPEYRQLAELRHSFDDLSIHAFTATATPRVREDICDQLKLVNPHILVGNFDRTNLTYRVLPRSNMVQQVTEIIERHRDEAVIVYCTTRDDTENLAAMLRQAGHDAEAYHAGLESNARRRVQDSFANETLNIVVATVAFGMGIDRSNVRCVIHAAMPKSVEHYQQESGRAGRDGLEAECTLLYSGADPMRWERILDYAIRESDDPDWMREQSEPQRDMLRHMQSYCSTAICRHRALVEYFGQEYGDEPCGSCDVCLGEVDALDDSTTVARKILSGIARLDQRFGLTHVVQVLRGSDTENVRKWRHSELSVYGLLKEVPDKVLKNLVFQLIDQGFIQRAGGDRPILSLTDDGVELLRGEREVQLLNPKLKRVKKTAVDAASWDGVDRELFERLRAVRTSLAGSKGVAPFLVFSDRSLRDMARIRPVTEDSMRTVHGVGDRKLRDFGEAFLTVIRDYCDANGIDGDGAVT